MEVRITDLPGGRVYGEGTDAVPIRLQVDAPEGAFAGGQDSVFVGLDEDRDRELSGERKLRLTSDRQAELFLEQAGPAGELTIGTRVGDFALDIPTVGSRGGRVGVLAELALAGRSVWSEPVEIVLDGSSPRLLQPRLRPGAEIPLGEEFELSVLATDDDLSGVAKVEAAIDVAAIGRFAEKPKPVPAEQDPDTGAWIAKLPTAKLPLGAYRLLMRATDQVGNVSEYGSVTIQIVPPASQAAMDTNQVSGTAFYGSQPIADVQVKLTPAAEGPSIAPAVTSELGVFVFTAVPPGKYLLQARALINNEFRLAEAEVEVAAPPAQATIQDLKLRSAPAPALGSGLKSSRPAT